MGMVGQVLSRFILDRGKKSCRYYSLNDQIRKNRRKSYFNWGSARHR